MSPGIKRWLTFSLRWGIAVAGIAWVLGNITFRDRVTILDPKTDRPLGVHVLGTPSDSDSVFTIRDASGSMRQISPHELWTRSEPAKVVMAQPGEAPQTVTVLAVRPLQPGAQNPLPAQYLIQQGKGARPQLVPPRDILTPPTITYPLVDKGVLRLVHEARPAYLWAALAVFPVTYIITAIRWNSLLRALHIDIGLPRAFVLNAVGQFYSTFMPGSTGGDVLKAFYAAKHTPLRTRAVMSVIIDRAIGLLALVILGAVMAACQWNIPACRNVALASAALIAMVALGLIVFYTPILRRFSGLDFILRRLPMQKQVHKAVETMEIYRARPWLMLGALLVTFPVHMATTTSAMLAGKAFYLPLDPLYYWAAVPVIVLVGAIPISPQGAGVMEAFAFLLLRPQGVTVSQAVILTMSIRLVQISWNLVAGAFVLRGGYHAPTQKEQEAMEVDESPARAVSGA